MNTITRSAKLRRSLVVVVGVLSIGSLAAAASADLFLAECMLFAEPNPDRQIGSNDVEADPTINGSPFHYGGEDCARCHVEGGKATNYVFTMAGTIYKDYEGSEALEGAEIILEDATGKTISMTSNEEGNFFTFEPMSGFYKSWIVHGDRTVPMVTLPSVGTTTWWMSCNMHHSPGSRRGALYVPDGSTLPDTAYQPDVVSFRKHVQPILNAQCSVCHMPAAANPVTTQRIDGDSHSYDYSGKLDLSSWAAIDLALVETPELINTQFAERSSLITKMIAGAQHAGGTFWKITDPDYQIILRWIQEGAQDN